MKSLEANAVATYVAEVARLAKTGKATEHTFRGALAALIDALVPGLRAVNEPKRTDCGAPDYIVQDRTGLAVFYVEAKDIGDNDLDGKRRTGHKEQFDRYKAALGTVNFNAETGFGTDPTRADTESNLSDSRVFAGLGYQFRGQILKPIMGNLDSNPPVSINSESFYKSAGCEIITAHIGGVDSKRRQIMNQADYFYYSGHGRHSDASLEGLKNGPRLTPSLVSSFWNRDLKCVVFAGCSVLDINDYNGHYDGTAEHTSSPGKLWANIEGPTSFLGYAYDAPRDTQGADRIASAWVANRSSMGDVDAWMKANDNRNGRNACAIDSSRNFHYFKKSFGEIYSRKIVPQGDL